MFRFSRLARADARGFAFVYALMGIAIISTVFYTISSFVNLHSRKTYEDLNVSQGRMILHSLMDYSVLAVKSRFCLTDSFLPEKTGCDLSHPRSIDRLVISPDSERYILKLVRARKINAPTPVRLEEIRAIVNLSDLLPEHPLYEMIGPLRMIDSVAKISFLIRRDKRPKMATTGRETFLHLEIELLESNGSVAKFVGSELKASADLSVFPRELGSMALIVANDLHMDLPSSPVENGNFNIHMFASRSAASGFGGLVFASPVLVNGDVYLPPAAPGNTDGGYAAVTFADKVYFPGKLFRGGTDIFAPTSSGRADDQLWTDIKEFGGFQRGVEIEPGYDRGLSNLSGGGPTNIDTSLAERCLQMIQVKSELKWTAASELQAKLIDGNLESGIRYRVGFGTPVYFPNPLMPQPANFRPAGPTFSGVQPDRPGIGTYNRPTANAGGPLAPLPGTALTATLIINTGPGQGAGQQLRIAVNMEYGSRYSYTYSVPVAGKKNEVENELRQVEARLAVPTILPAERLFLMDRRERLRAELDELNQAGAKTSTIELEVQPVMTDRDGPQPVFADLIVRRTGELVNVKNQPATMSVRVEAYDISCRAGVQRCREEIFPSNDVDANSPYRSGYSRVGYLNGLGTTNPTGLGDDENDSGSRSAINDGVNYAALENQCTYKGQSLGGVTWDSEIDSKFAAGAPIYWNFAQNRRGSTTCPNASEYCFDATNARTSGPSSTAQFHVRSIVPTCLIRNSANFVSGFMTCERLIVEARTQPLTIVGTFIVTKGLTIDPSAYRAGIWWSSIYNSMATPELRRANILRPNTAAPGLNPALGSSCGNAAVPMWHPYPSMSDTANVEACNVGSLRSQAKPFTWTAVDPDCGLIEVPGEIPYQCKNQLTRYQVFEIFRESRL